MILKIVAYSSNKNARPDLRKGLQTLAKKLALRKEIYHDLDEIHYLVDIVKTIAGFRAIIDKFFSQKRGISI